MEVLTTGNELYLQRPGPQHVNVRTQVHEALRIDGHQVGDFALGGALEHQNGEAA